MIHYYPHQSQKHHHSHVSHVTCLRLKVGWSMLSIFEILDSILYGFYCVMIFNIEIEIVEIP